MKVASQEGPRADQQEGVNEEQHPPVAGGFLPLAHTCSNVLEVPRPTDKICLPPLDRLL